jgi:hypothetical protein
MFTRGFLSLGYPGAEGTGKPREERVVPIKSEARIDESVLLYARYRYPKGMVSGFL